MDTVTSVTKQLPKAIEVSLVNRTEMEEIRVLSNPLAVAVADLLLLLSATCKAWQCTSHYHMYIATRSQYCTCHIRTISW